MLQNYTDLLPLRGYSEHDVLPFYSQNGTGVGGRFVVLETGNNSPTTFAGFAGSVGQTITNTFSPRFENPRKFRLATSGDGMNVIGMTLYGTIETDANGQKIKLEPELKKELGIVTSGESSPIAFGGYFRLKSSAYSGIPLPGHVGTIHNTEPGKVAFAAASTISDKSLVVCKVISSSGNGFGGGYADILLALKG